MRQITPEEIQRMKGALEKSSGKEVSLQEATEAANNLNGLVELVFKLTIKKLRKEKELKIGLKQIVKDKDDNDVIL